MLVLAGLSAILRARQVQGRAAAWRHRGRATADVRAAALGVGTVRGERVDQRRPPVEGPPALPAGSAARAERAPPPGPRTRRGASERARGRRRRLGGDRVSRGGREPASGDGTPVRPQGHRVNPRFLPLARDRRLHLLPAAHPAVRKPPLPPSVHRSLPRRGRVCGWMRPRGRPHPPSRPRASWTGGLPRAIRKLGKSGTRIFSCVSRKRRVDTNACARRRGPNYEPRPQNGWSKVTRIRWVRGDRCGRAVPVSGCPVDASTRSKSVVWRCAYP